MRILITGGNGQLGRALRAALAADDVVALGHAELDITDVSAVKRALAEARPRGGRTILRSDQAAQRRAAVVRRTQRFEAHLERLPGEVRDGSDDQREEPLLQPLGHELRAGTNDQRVVVETDALGVLQPGGEVRPRDVLGEVTEGVLPEHASVSVQVGPPPRAPRVPGLDDRVLDARNTSGCHAPA